jgi:predicted nucleic acid-binding protein
VSAVFVDTAAFLALFAADDAWHASAMVQMTTMHRLRQPLLTSSQVLYEVAAAFSRHDKRDRATSDRHFEQAGFEILLKSP